MYKYLCVWYTPVGDHEYEYDIVSGDAIVPIKFDKQIIKYQMATVVQRHYV